MIEPAIMQVISKSVDYSRNETELKLFETSIKDIIRKIKGQAGDTLDTVATGDYISDSLLSDVKDKQDGYLTNFNDYLTEIDDYADTDPRANLSPYQSYSYNFSEITAGIILEDENIIYQILSEIMNNEGFYYERRVSIRSMLWYIRNIIVDTYMFGYYEVNMDNFSTFEAITEENLILEDIYDVLEGGDQTMILKSNTITNTHIGTVYGTIDSDEVLHSIDNFVTSLPSTASATCGIKNSGGAISLESAGLGDDIDKTIDAPGTYGKSTLPYINVSGSGVGISTTLTYTTRKIINYT